MATNKRFHIVQESFDMGFLKEHAKEINRITSLVEEIIIESRNSWRKHLNFKDVVPKICELEVLLRKCHPSLKNHAFSLLRSDEVMYCNYFDSMSQGEKVFDSFASLIVTIGEAAVEPILEELEFHIRNDYSSSTINARMYVLTRIGSKKVIPYLHEYAMGEGNALAHSAVYNLASIGDESSLELLRKRLRTAKWHSIFFKRKIKRAISEIEDRLRQK